MSVGSWEPDAGQQTLDGEIMAAFVAAADRLDEPGFGLSGDEVTRLAGFSRHAGDCDWAGAAVELGDDAIEALIRLFTLAERLPGWEAGARSPVIPLAAALKKRGEYPSELSGWIKSNTDNRFLPYGSLMDRL